MRNARTIACLLGGILVSAVSPITGQARPADHGQNDGRVTVHVVNRNFADVRVYAESGVSRWRIGSVSGLSQADLRLPRYLTGMTEPITLIAYAIGGGGATATQITALPGDEIVFNLEPNFALSYARLVPRP